MNVCLVLWCSSRSSHCRNGSVFFFVQAEDGIRGGTVTGVQTCALPIAGNLVDRIRLAAEPRGQARVDDDEVIEAIGKLVALDRVSGTGSRLEDRRTCLLFATAPRPAPSRHPAHAAVVLPEVAPPTPAPLRPAARAV